MKLILAATCAAVILGAASADAQGTQVSISAKATYEDALACHQYYAAGADLARKLEKAPETNADQAAAFQLQAIFARQLRDLWMSRIAATAGKRSEAVIEGDMKKQAELVVYDGNAALAGDKAAAERGRGRSARCSKLEVVQKG